MSPQIIQDRLNHRVRVLRVRWHAQGDQLLKAGSYLEFTDGLLRLIRQLDSIDSAITRLSAAGRAGMGGFGAMPPTTARSRSERPSRRPAGGIV